MYTKHMDNRKIEIRELEAKNLSVTKTRNKLLEGLGENLFKRIGEQEPFDTNAADTPGVLLEEYRNLLKDIDESLASITSLEKELVRIKELEETIAVKAAEESRLEEELQEFHEEIGKTLLEDADYHDATGAVRRQEENLLARIHEQETKLEELESQTGGFFSWLGRNAQMTVSKTVLSKNRSALRKLYRDVGKKYLLAEPDSVVNGAINTSAERARELEEHLSSLSTELSARRGERRMLEDQFGVEGSPSRRIQGLEKHITLVKGKFPAIHFGMGVLAAEKRVLVSSFLSAEDDPVLEEAGFLKTELAQNELKIEKLKTAIKIDNEKNEIEKMKKAINSHEDKIAAAKKAITEIKNQISDTEQTIQELQTFLNNNAET